jgi:uncharacterized protein
MSFRPSRFLHTFRLSGGLLALYNAATLKVAFLNADGIALWHMFCDSQGHSLESGQLTDNLVDQAILQLVQDGFLVGSREDEDERLLNRYQHLIPHDPEITVLKLFLTTHCNLDCRYCLISKNLNTFDRKPRHTLFEVAVKALQVFADHACRSNKPEKNIFFYGGEPLTNYHVLKELVETIRRWESGNRFNGSLELVLETNGLLLTKNICDFLAANSVFIIVSIDGLPIVHDRMRPKHSGADSFFDALNGFRTAVEAGCTTVVSTVATTLMLNHIESAIEFLVNEVKTPSIGLDLLHLRQGCQEDDLVMETEELVSAYIKAFEIARDYGLYIEHIMRRIRPFVNESVRLKDCPACGNRMVVAPDGAIGLCEGFIGSREFFVSNVFDEPDLHQDVQFRLWNRCSPLLDRACFGCVALAICGGGCPYNSYVAGGKLLGYDEKTCDTSKGFIKWLIEDLAQQIGKEALAHQTLHVATKEEKAKIFGNIPARLTLPLIKNISEHAERDVIKTS